MINCLNLFFASYLDNHLRRLIEFPKWDDEFNFGVRMTSDHVNRFPNINGWGR